MSKITDDAYERLQKMLGDRNSAKEIVDISLTQPEKTILYGAVAEKLKKHASCSEYEAGLVADHIVNIVSEFINLKLKTAQQEEKSIDGPVFRRSE